MKRKNDYIAPRVEEFCIEMAGCFCIGSGATHEGTSEEDLDEALLLNLIPGAHH